jgi:leucine-rich repeat protein SHOC2
MLAYNLINVLPESIGELKKLREITLSGNKQLSALPAGLKELKNIEVFEIGNTQISEIPFPDEGWVNLKLFKTQMTMLKCLP